MPYYPGYPPNNAYHGGGFQDQNQPGQPYPYQRQTYGQQQGYAEMLQQQQRQQQRQQQQQQQAQPLSSYGYQVPNHAASYPAPQTYPPNQYPQHPSFQQSPSPSLSYGQNYAPPYDQPSQPLRAQQQQIPSSPDPLHFHQESPRFVQSGPPRGFSPQEAIRRQPSQPLIRQTVNLHTASNPGNQPTQFANYNSQSNSSSGGQHSQSRQYYQEQPTPSPRGTLPVSGPNTATPQQDMARTQRLSQPQPQRPQQPQQLVQKREPEISPPPGTINPQLIHPLAVHVQIPVQRSAKKTTEPPLEPPIKRRRSNDGEAVSVGQDRTVQQQSVKQLQTPQRGAPSSSPLTELTSSQIPPTPTPTNSVDYQAVLLALSDEYIKAAYSMSAELATTGMSDDDLEDYHGLLSTGMACLETILKNYRVHDPRKEVRIRLRFASLLHEETENSTEAEEVLSKGIVVCERGHLSNAKYAMHHLLARIWFKGGKVKAAMKTVEKLILETEKLSLVHWIYAFRFLRISFGLQVAVSTAETAALVRHLEAASNTSQRHRHIAVQIVSCTLEALIHLRSRSNDSVDLANRALAAVRMHQLSAEMKAMPQVQTLLDCIDLCSHLLHPDSREVVNKMTVMRNDMESNELRSQWNKDSSWHLALGDLDASHDIEQDTGGIMAKTPNGHCALNLTWLSRVHADSLGYLMSGIASMHADIGQESKAVKWLGEGVKNCNIKSHSLQQSLTATTMQRSSLSMIQTTLRLYGAFAYCHLAEWGQAMKGLTNIRHDIPETGPGSDPATTALYCYLQAVCKQALGDISGALLLYNSPKLALDWNAVAHLVPGTIDPVKMLAALNSVLITRSLATGNDGNTSSDDTSTSMMDRLGSICQVILNSNGNEWGNKSIEAAYYILKATERDDSQGDVIIKRKGSLQSALQAAQNPRNTHLLTVIMNLMTDVFFHNIVGDQAERSAAAGRGLAHKSRDKLWVAVADRMYGDTLEICGKGTEAEVRRIEAQSAMQELPESLAAALASNADTRR